MIDQQVGLEALRVLVMIDERRAKLIGLDAPRRQAVTVISDDALDQEIAWLTPNLERRQSAPLELEAGSGGAS